MVLPVPDLDNRHFQELVDDAKRYVQNHCPEWTDHNVSDPGVTLIEATAQMVEQLIYRLNRVPDRHYMKFLELIGIDLLAPGAARGQVTFWLSAPQPQTLVVRAETEVATPRTDTEAPIVFSTEEDLEIVHCSRSFLAATKGGSNGEAEDKTRSLRGGKFTCFSEPPRPGDALMIGLSAAVPSCAVLLQLDCVVKGIGINPDDPPLVWEAWDGHGWTACELDRDETGGLNRSGSVVIHVPPTHRTSVVAIRRGDDDVEKQRAGWLRCQVIPARPKQEPYRESPELRGVTASTIGGTVGIVHAEVIRNEYLGVSDGTAGQRFALQRQPVILQKEPVVVEATTGDEVEEWTQVDHFADSSENDKHYRIDPVGGEVVFGPVVRERGGKLHYYGHVPTKDTHFRLVSYRTGGGQRGNVARGNIRVLKTSVPYVGRVENRVSAVGGAEGETVENAKTRAPLVLRSRGRAVTAEDFELLAREVAPEAARIRCLPATRPEESGGIRVLVVPHAPHDDVGRVALEDLTPPDATLTRITAHLDERRMVGTRMLVTVPTYVAVSVVPTIQAKQGYLEDAVRSQVVSALYAYLDPMKGGPDGTGWPFGRPVQEHDLFPVLQLPSVDTAVRPKIEIFVADQDTWARRKVERIDVPPDGLIFSYDHQAVVMMP